MSKGGDNLPDLSYFLNNGREDITHEELTELLTLIGKVSYDKSLRRGGDGASFPQVEFNSVFACTDEAGTPEPFPGHGEGVSLDGQGLEGTVVEILTDTATQTLPEPDAEWGTDAEDRPSCEGRMRRPWESAVWDDFDNGQPDYPDDHEYL